MDTEFVWFICHLGEIIQNRRNVSSLKSPRYTIYKQFKHITSAHMYFMVYFFECTAQLDKRKHHTFFNRVYVLSKRFRGVIFHSVDLHLILNDRIEL